MIDLLTFTGVDVKTSLKELSEISIKYSKAEFAVLVGNNSGKMDYNRFPSLNIVEEFKQEKIIQNKAIHLCGGYAVDAMSFHGDFVYDLCSGFDRVQVNVKEEDSYWYRRAIERFADEVPCSKVIIQHRKAWGKVPVIHEKVEYLFDCSGGRGKEGFKDWPKPLEKLNRMGYAGGIGPDNINRVIEFDSDYVGCNFWFDMEGNIRVDDWYDLSLIEFVCEYVFGV